MGKLHLLRALSVGLIAVPLYAFFLFLAELAMRTTSFSLSSSYAHQYAAVFPGALILSLVVQRLASGSPVRGAVTGSLLGLLNAPFSMLCVLLWWQMRAELGLTEPWRYGWEGLWGQWCRDFFAMLLIGAPMAVPCGGLLGAWSGLPVGATPTHPS